MLRPTSWNVFKDPVIKIKRALYGLKRSGFDWNKKANEILSSLKWTEVRDYGGGFFIRAKSVLILYVDDLLLAGPVDQVNGFMTEISDKIKLSKICVLDEFLGIRVSPIFELPTGFLEITLSQVGYAKLLVERYMQCVEVKQLKKAGTPAVDYAIQWEGDEKPGLQAGSCRTHVVGLLFLARATRPDLSYAVGLAARYVSNWTVFADKILLRIFQYLAFHTDLDFFGEDC